MLFRGDCFILREVNVQYCPLAALFEIITKYIATPERNGRGGVGVGGGFDCGNLYFCLSAA